MKFLMMSKYAEGAHTLWKIKQSGNDVALYIDNPAYKDTWKGILPRLGKDWEGFVDSDTTVIFDTTGLGDKVDYLRRKGINTWGGGELADKLECDRSFAMEYAKKWGMKIPKYFEFTKIPDAIKFIQSNPQQFVFKPEGDEIPSKLTYCSEDAEDLINYLKDFIEPCYGKKLERFILQEFVKGVDVSTEVWISGGKIVGPPNRTIEAKNFMNDDKGPSTGCAGNITWPCDEDFIFKAGESVATSSHFFQQLDWNVVVTEDNQIYFLEFTPRRGYDATPTLEYLINDDLGELYYKLAREEIKELDIEDRTVGSVRITVPPYPVDLPDEHECEQIPIRGLPAEYKDNYYFYEIMLNKDKNLIHTGESGSIGIVISSGYSPEECFSLPYEILENARIPDLQYRTDLVKVFDEELEKLENVTNNSYREVVND